MKVYRFFYHYNKPMSAKRNKPTISIHYKKQCMMVDNFVCMVPTRGKVNKQQPRFVVTGKATEITIKEGIAYIR